MATKTIERESLCPLEGFDRKQRLIRVQPCHTIKGDYTDGVIRPVEKVVYYYIAVCEKCKGPLVYAAETDDVKNNFAKAELLYPPLRKLPENIPKKIAKYYEIATHAKRRDDPKTFAMNIRMALEAICTNLGVPDHNDGGKGFKNLGPRIDELAKKALIPNYVQEMMKDLTAGCNFGAHDRPEDERVDPAFCSMIDDFFNAVVQMIYVAPKGLKEFHDRVQAAKRQAKQRKARQRSNVKY